MYKLAALALLAAREATAAPAIVERSSIPVSDNTLSLDPVNITAPSSQALLAAARASVPLKSADGGAGYSVATTLGSQTFNLIFDTGSSDLWVPKTNFQCQGANGGSKPAKYCGFGPEFSGSYSGGQIPNKNFEIVYGDQEHVSGTLGYESVTIAGVNVPKQEISLVNKGYFHANGVSGLVGFAYNYLTSQYPGTNPGNDKPSNVQHYSNFIKNAISSGKINALFTVILDRGGSGSTLTLGGVPSSAAGLKYTSTPIKQVDLENLPGGANHYTFYTIKPQALVINGQTVSTNFPGIVDTGTTLFYVPDQYAADVAAGYSPPAVLDEAAGLYVVSCSATPPKLAVKIGGTNFFINPDDLLIQANKAGTVCATGVQPGGNFAIMGDVFLKNVVAVFDRGAAEMKFAPHENY